MNTKYFECMECGKKFDENSVTPMLTGFICDKCRKSDSTAETIKTIEKDVVEQIYEMLAGIDEITEMKIPYCTLGEPNYNELILSYDDGTEFQIIIKKI